MVKPAATNMTITLQQSSVGSVAVKPLVIGEQLVVHTNAAQVPILPHQPVAAEQDQTPVAEPVGRPSFSLEQIAGLSLDKAPRPTGAVKLRDFTREQNNLLGKRYPFKTDA